MCRDTKKFTSLKFSGPHPKPHGVQGSSNHYHLKLQPKLGHGTYAINLINFFCVVCKITESGMII